MDFLLVLAQCAVFTAHAARQLAQVPFPLILFLPLAVRLARKAAELRTREKGIRKSASLAKHRPLQIIPYIADFISLCDVCVCMCVVHTML